MTIVLLGFCLVFTVCGVIFSATWLAKILWALLTLMFIGWLIYAWECDQASRY